MSTSHSLLISALGWFSSLSSEVKAASVGGIATLIAASLGFGAIVLQMSRQGAHSRATLLEAEARKFKAEMYREGVAAARDMHDSAIEFSTALRLLNVGIAVAANAGTEGRPVPAPIARYPEIAALFQAHHSSLIRLMGLIEERQIIDPRIIIFRDVLSSAGHLSRKLFYEHFTAAVMQLIPINNPANDGILPYRTPTSGDSAAASHVISQMLEVLSDIGCVSDDLIVDLQNVLLGDLFQTKVHHRQPLDPSHQVITLDRHEELQAFLESTDWGTKRRQLEDEVRASLTAKQTPPAAP